MAICEQERWGFNTGDALAGTGIHGKMGMVSFFREHDEMRGDVVNCWGEEFLGSDDEGIVDLVPRSRQLDRRCRLLGEATTDSSSSKVLNQQRAGALETW